ncbi:hypothetical protein GUJ93_ZPchr0002g23895 [Zizania palustris]|uniref:Uncharacterized protein n=1 Tax=Zizania palustris TaxID=103762 RepID=A0A8J5RV18_ZIZPA|nr:hypothetical protein GUJ93_ZPchr0002g23895 [Zizania palustris]
MEAEVEEMCAALLHGAGAWRSGGAVAVAAEGHREEGKRRKMNNALSSSYPGNGGGCESVTPAPGGSSRKTPLDASRFVSSMTGIHYDGKFYEFVPWTGACSERGIALLRRHLGTGQNTSVYLPCSLIKCQELVYRDNLITCIATLAQVEIEATTSEPLLMVARER